MIANANEILAAADIVDVVRRYVPDLSPTSGGFSARCPFHHGQGQSFKVDPQRGRWRCWSTCAVGGDALDFIARIRGLSIPGDFLEAIEILAEDIGIPVRYEQGNPDTARSGPTRSDLHAAIAAAHTHYQANLAANPDAMAYLAKRGITAELAKQWELGYSKGAAVLALGLPEEHLLAAGIVQRGDKSGELYDPLQARILFPQRSPHGRVVGYSGRSPNPEIVPKYRNTHETTLYRKGQVLFGYFAAARMPGPAHVVEGQLKAIACQHAGIRAVAPCGTAFTDAQAALLAAWNCPIHLALDNESAGHDATIKAATLLRRHNLPVHVATLQIPPGIEAEGKLDPDDLLARHQPIAYTAEGFLPWLCRTYTADLFPSDKARMVRARILPLIAETADPLLRSAELQELAHLTGLPHPSLMASLPPPAPTRPEAPAKLPFDTRITPGRMLVSACLLAPVFDDESEGWADYIRWTHIPLPLLAALQRVYQVRRYATEAKLLLGPAIHRAAGNHAQQFDYWATIDHPSAIDPQYLHALQLSVNQEPAS